MSLQIEARGKIMGGAQLLGSKSLEISFPIENFFKLTTPSIHTSAKLIEIKIKFLQPKHSPQGTVRQMESNETPHTPWGLRHL